MQPDSNDIAIVGMAIRVPGAATPEQYWANLRDGVESRSTLGEEALLARGVSRATLADPDYVRAAMVLDGVEQFDPEFFGFSAREAAILDPQHRQFYEVCWEALERAGHPPAGFDGAIGVFAGCGMGAYFAYNILSNSELLDSVGLFLLRHTGNDKDFLATRVSYAFDLKGPSINVQTACSTSLVAAHMAVQSLLSGETDLALAGGVTIEIPHAVGYHYKEGEILSPDGHCRTFDHRSKGTVFGSGTGVVVLRRLADAIADGDHIHAVIKGTAVNNDGAGKVGYLAPSVEGQAAAVAEALAVADVDAATIGYVECHGTGTPVGDPIEIAALTRAFRESTERVGYCRVGSVKSNIGHLDTAAGVASLIKAALALEHGMIPPTLNFEAPNPAIAFDGSPFVVASTLQPWAANGAPRRAGVNSLGVGGTNAFAVLEEAPRAARAAAEATGPELLVLSARSRRALDDASQKLASWLRDNTATPLADICWSLMAGRHGFEHRRVLGASSHAEAADLLEQGDARRVYTHTLEVERPNVVFMYPGGGAQYFRMGRDLHEREPVFRREIDMGLALLRERFKTDLGPVFFAEMSDREATVEELSKPSVQLPLTFLVEYALTRLLEHYGVKPTALIGHSMGENTAACIAGVISFEDALGLVLLRGQLMDEVPEGGMLSVPLPVEALRAAVGDDLDIAAANSPQLSVASGHNQRLDELAARLAARGIETQRVRINIAAHSRMLENITCRFRDYLASIELKEPQLPIVSNRTGEWLPPARARNPDYWVEHLRNTVLFGKGVETLLEKGESVFIEVGPGSTLGSFVRQNPEAPAQRVFGSMRHPDAEVGDTAHFRAMLGRLWAVGAAFDTEKLWAPGRRRVPLPTYPFQHSAYWIEPGQAKALDDRDRLRPLRADDRNDWFWSPRWIQQGVLEWSEEPKTWWVFHEREPLAARLIEALKAVGHRVVSILAGDTFAALGPDVYTVAPDAGGAGYQELVDTLLEAGLPPERILHTWLITWDDSHRPGSSFFHRNQNFGFYSLFHLARALAKSATPPAGTHLVVLANGVQRIAGEFQEYPEKATVAGPCAVIPHELPGVTVSFVDVELTAAVARRGRTVDRDATAARLAQDLAVELKATPATTTIAWRNGVRWQRRIVPERLPPESAPRLKRGGVYLITGGLGGIGGAIAEWLARDYAAKLVLVGRTPLPAREEWDDWLLQHEVEDSISRSILRIRALETLGSQVSAVGADVTVGEQMKAAVDETEANLGAISGVFHAAGVIRDALIPMKSQRDIEEVFAAKVYGTLVLDELFRDKPLDFLFLFSSISTFTAPQGQIDYVGANAFLNAYAESRRGERPYPVIAANWGIWRDVGMAAPSLPGSGSDVDAEIQRGARFELPHPLFDVTYASRDGLLDVRVFEGTLSAEKHWIIDEHRLIGGQALLPGTGFIELIRSALAVLDEATPWRIANLVFQRPIFVADGTQRGFRVRLRGGRGRWDAEVLAAPTGPTGGVGASWDVCATARVVADASARAGRLPIAEIESRLHGGSEIAAGSGTLRTAQEAHLKFGSHWRVLKRIDLGDGEALARLELPEALKPELASYGLHPGLLDIATGCAMNLIPDYAEQDAAENLWVPIGYRGIRYFASLDGGVVSWLRLGGDSRRDAGFASFDVVIADAAGQILVEVTGLTLRRLQGTLRASEFERSPESVESGEGDRADTRRQKLSPGEQALQHNLSQGIRAAEGIAVIARLLRTELPGGIIVSSIRPPDLFSQADAVTAASMTRSDTQFSRPELDSDFEAPRNDVEKSLAEIWGKLLGVDGIGIHDSFFDLGGHSLIAVRLFNELNDRFGVDLPMSVLMQRPTIAGLGEMVTNLVSDTLMLAPGANINVSDTKFTPAPTTDFHFVVPMHSGPVAGGTPLFVVSGMFGNVLNLSHLAHLLGEERPFYALQARGLYGDSTPHESFEEAAADYIAEIRKVQPVGPYLLGGYSGGGITAYEMARQLLEIGETVAGVILFDTPLPQILRFSFKDKLMMRQQRIRAGGWRFVRDKLVSKLSRPLRRGNGRSTSAVAALGGQVQFQSERIGAAFVRSVEKYRLQPIPVDVFLFRPRLVIAYEITGGRKLTPNFQLAIEDNGWGTHVRSVRVYEVPGNHDSMVLEPNVRVLVASLKRAIDRALAPP